MAYVTLLSGLFESHALKGTLRIDKIWDGPGEADFLIAPRLFQ
jgi:hypothetical protein